MIFTIIVYMSLLYFCRQALSCKCNRGDVSEILPENIGKVLVNHGFVSLYLRSEALCAARCLRQKKCKSINFDRKERICALNAETHLTKAEQFVATSNKFVVYYTIDEWVKILKTPCAAHTCDDEKICIPGYLGEGQLDHVCFDDFTADLLAPEIDFGGFVLSCIVETSCANCMPPHSIEVAGITLEYQAVGCYLSEPANILSTLIEDFTLSIDWPNWETAFPQVVQNCASISKDFSFFGVKNYGLCYAASNLGSAVATQGEVPITLCDHSCLAGVGGAAAMFVYSCQNSDWPENTREARWYATKSALKDTHAALVDTVKLALGISHLEAKISAV